MKFFITLSVFLLSISVQSQILKSRAVILQITNESDNSDELKPNQTIIVYDKLKKRIRLYDPNSSPDKIFDILELIDQEPLKKDKNIIASTVSMIDQDGKKIKGVIFSNKKGIKGLTLWYEKLTYTYTAEPLD